MLFWAGLLLLSIGKFEFCKVSLIIFVSFCNCVINFNSFCCEKNAIIYFTPVSIIVKPINTWKQKNILVLLFVGTKSPYPIIKYSISNNN